LKIGFIGTGSMGRTLVEAFIRSGKLSPQDLFIHNRTRAKAELLASKYPGIHVAADNRELVRQTRCIFLCMKPSEFRRVLEEIRGCTTRDHIVVSITSPVMIQDLEEWLPAKIAKIIPSITHAVFSGNSLFIPGSRLTTDDQTWLKDLFSAISSPLEVDERHARIASDLASCSPAFFANMLEKMADAAVKETGIPRESAVSLVTQMVQGLGKLLTEGGFTLQTLQERVAVPGGITREGLELLEKEVSPIFIRLIQLTHNKYEEDIEKVQKTLYNRVEKNVP
jgi:competence protein ComER